MKIWGKLERYKVWEKIKKYEDFYYEFQYYAKCKKDLQARPKEQCPKSCIKDYERREKVISDFENKYLSAERN